MTWVDAMSNSRNFLSFLRHSQLSCVYQERSYIIDPLVVQAQQSCFFLSQSESQFYIFCILLHSNTDTGIGTRAYKYYGKLRNLAVQVILLLILHNQVNARLSPDPSPCGDLGLGTRLTWQEHTYLMSCDIHALIKLHLKERSLWCYFDMGKYRSFFRGRSLISIHSRRVHQYWWQWNVWSVSRNYHACRSMNIAFQWSPRIYVTKLKY